LHAFHDRYPSAKVLAPRGSREKVATVVPSVEDLRVLSDERLELDAMAGTKDMEAVMAVKTANGTTVVLADAIFDMPHLHGFHGFVLRHITKSSGGPHVSRVARLFMIKDKPAFAEHLRRLATPELKRVIVAHHEMITEDPAGTLRAVADTLC
jgi:hypothetical protein